MLKEYFEKMIERRENQPDIDDDVTTDKYLRSLRRERRTQMEELEKKRLLRQINNYKKTKMKKELYGLDSDNIMKEKKPYIDKVKKTKQTGFFGRYKL